jgi:hypothetical protein
MFIDRYVSELWPPMGLLFIPPGDIYIYIYIYEYEEPWWTDIDRRKLLIHPPELSGNSTSSNRVAKQEEIKEILNVAYEVCL